LFLQYDRALYQSEFTQLILFNIIPYVSLRTSLGKFKQKQALHSSTHSQLKDKKKQKQDWIKWHKKEQRKQKQSQKMQD